jgi:hypothetical protein
VPNIRTPCSASFAVYVSPYPNSLSHAFAHSNTHQCVVGLKPSLPAFISSSIIDLFRPGRQIPFGVSFVSTDIFTSRKSYLLVTYFQEAVESHRQSCAVFYLYSACPQDFTREALPLCNYWPHSEPRACEEPGESASLPFY